MLTKGGYCVVRLHAKSKKNKAQSLGLRLLYILRYLISKCCRDML